MRQGCNIVLKRWKANGLLGPWRLKHQPLDSAISRRLRRARQGRLGGKSEPRRHPYAGEDPASRDRESPWCSSHRGSTQPLVRLGLWRRHATSSRPLRTSDLAIRPTADSRNPRAVISLEPVFKTQPLPLATVRLTPRLPHRLAAHDPRYL